MATFAAPTESVKGHAPRPGSRMWRENPLGSRLMRHFGTFPSGRNVYYLTSGTVTENDPDGTDVSWDDVAHVWWGGHAAETVTAAQEAALTAAGYTVIP